MTSDQTSFTWDSGRLALDFMATLGDRAGSAPIERLAEPELLRAWIRDAGLGDRAAGVGRNELADAHRLRELLFELVEAAIAGTEPRGRAVRELNRLAAAPLAPPRLVLEEGRLERRQDTGSAAFLAALARDAIDLITSPELDLLRECEAEDCSGVYVDASRGRRRRWCSASRCGNRARVAAHRARRRVAAAEQ